MDNGKTKGKKIRNQNEEKRKNLSEVNKQQEKIADLYPLLVPGIITLILDGSKSADHIEEGAASETSADETEKPDG